VYYIKELRKNLFVIVELEHKSSLWFQ